MAATDTKRAARQTSSSPSSRKPGSKADWGRKAVHLITLLSGQEVKIRIPNLGLLLEGDALPQTLRNAALTELVDPMAARVARGATEDGGPGVSLDEVKELYHLHQWLVVQTVVEPELTLADLPDLPQEDLEMLTQIATRERTTDAAGRQLGTEPLSRWETFRSYHRCEQGCEACQKVVDSFSTVER